MRTFLLSLLMIASAAASTAHAGSFEKCQQKETDATGLRTCTETERNRAAILLRKQNKQASTAVEKIAKEKQDRVLVNQFHAGQARHVRVRKNTCRKLPSKNEQVACEADMDYEHVEKLKRYTQD